MASRTAISRDFGEFSFKRAARRQRPRRALRRKFVLRFAVTIEFGGNNDASESLRQDIRPYINRGLPARPSDARIGGRLGECSHRIGAKIDSETPQFFGGLFVADVPAEVPDHRLQIFLNRDGRVLHFDTRRQERNFRDRTFFLGRGALLLAKDIVIARFAIAAYHFLRGNLRWVRSRRNQEKG